MSDSSSIAALVTSARDPERALDERHAAFEQLVSRSRHLVIGHARAMLAEPAEADDVVQEAFLSAWLRLPQLRDAAAFTAWVHRIAINECRRRLRRRPPGSPSEPQAAADAPADCEADLVAQAVAALPAGEREAAVLFYYLGFTLEEAAQQLGAKPGTVGKRLHSARLRIRRRLPPSVRERFQRRVPALRFRAEVREGVYDEYLGDYRFDERPEHLVRIRREGDVLVAEGSGQRTVLAKLSVDAFATVPFDGHGRFARDRRGRVTHFVYYEFGRRLGTARKTKPRPPVR